MATTGAASVLSRLPGAQRRREPLLGLLRAQEDDPQRRLVGAGRAHFGQVDGAAQQLFRNRLVNESVMRARLVKKERKGIRGNCLGSATWTVMVGFL